MLLEDGRVVSNFIVQALKNNPITIYGSGNQTRCFCYIDDMIEALVLMMNSNPNVFGPLNLGNPKEICILDLAKLIVAKINSKSKIVFNEAAIDDPYKRKPSIKMAKKLLNWEPSINLNHGLEKTIEYFERKIF